MMRHIFWRRIIGEGSLPEPLSTLKSRKPEFLPTRFPPSSASSSPSTPPSPHDNLRATWLGHACFFTEFPSGLRVLFDPVFEDCCAPEYVKSADLRRFTPPPCELEDLPFLDVVCISHNHYDHLSYPSVKRIEKKFPAVRWFVPLGVRDWFVKSGVAGERVVELDWWEGRDITFSNIDSHSKSSERQQQQGGKHVEITKEGEHHNDTGNRKTITATISALPCQHTSARGAFDRARTLWCSWAISSPKPSSPSSPAANLYFAGDTGYRAVPKVAPGEDDYLSPAYINLPRCPAFKQIGQHYGPFDLGLIPIGAYEPRFVMSGMHSNPRDAVNIFLETRCRRALGMHWGTWRLTEEGVDEPPVKLREALREKGIGEEGVFDAVELGESREFVCGGEDEGRH
jgi:L-ascorbate metabolism protein UlaG (beta-lactamase superfamily)